MSRSVACLCFVAVGSAYRLGLPVMRAGQEVKFATNIKGALVWDLRTAKAADVGAIRGLSGDLYPEEVLSSLVATEHTIVGESGGAVVSAALVGTSRGAAPLGELLAVYTIPNAPEEIREKTALGALKKCRRARRTRAANERPARRTTLARAPDADAATRARRRQAEVVGLRRRGVLVRGG